jgi:hypothetical protein
VEIEFAGNRPLERGFLANLIVILCRISASAEDAMRPRERRETGEQDLFRSRLDQIIDMDHALAKLARTVDWSFLEGRFGEVYTDDPGQRPHSALGYLTPAAYAANLTATCDRLRNPDQFRRSHVALPAPDGVKSAETLIAAG